MPVGLGRHSSNLHAGSAVGAGPKVPRARLDRHQPSIRAEPSKLTTDVKLQKGFATLGQENSTTLIDNQSEGDANASVWLVRPRISTCPVWLGDDVVGQVAVCGPLVPTRVYYMRIDFAGVLPMFGLDTYQAGHGRMHGKVLGPITVADGPGPEFDISELMTYVNDGPNVRPVDASDTGG